MQEKISMPSSGGGLVRYFEDYESKIRFKPGHLVLFIILVIIIEFFLHARFN